MENIYLRNNSHDLQVLVPVNFLIFTMKRIISKTIQQDENAFFIHIVNSKTAPVFHKTFDWGTGEFENENGEKWSSPTELELYIIHQDRKK